MSLCELLQRAYEKAQDEENEVVATAILNLMQTAGCGVEPSSVGGGGDPPPEGP